MNPNRRVMRAAMRKPSALGQALGLLLGLTVGFAPMRPAFPQPSTPPSAAPLPSLRAATPVADTRRTDAACSTGPNGEATATPSDKLADRGIGGTGINASPSAPPVMEADRGIGGTGIVGVVTGFASICLNGREVAFTNDTPVVQDGAPAALSTLRAGQFTAVEAAGEGAGLTARRIAIRHEVSGPVEEVEADGMLRVAGQRVKVTKETWGAGPVAVGEWLAVSGLRAFDGVIDATRIDKRGPGEVLAHGLLVRDGARLRIGSLEVRRNLGGPTGAPATVPVPVGAEVTAVGRYSDGIIYADTLDPDLLVTNPVVYFGPAVTVFLVEGYATVGGGRLRIGPRFFIPAPGEVASFAPLRAVAEFRRGGNGALALTGLRAPGPRAGPGRILFAPHNPGQFGPRGPGAFAPRGAFAPHGPGAPGFGNPRLAPSPRFNGPRFGEPRFGEPRFGEPRFGGPGSTGPRGGGPRFEAAPVPHRGFERPGGGRFYRERRPGGPRGEYEPGPGGPGGPGPGFGGGGGFGGRR